MNEGMNEISNIDSDDEGFSKGVNAMVFGRTVESEYLNSSEVASRR